MAPVFMWAMIVVLSGMAVLSVALPTFLVKGMDRILHDSWIRFWSAQGLVLMGLILILGTSSFQAFWFWICCGGVFIGKGCLLLASSDRVLSSMAAWITQFPVWAVRIYGVLLLTFVGFFASQVIQNG